MTIPSSRRVGLGALVLAGLAAAALLAEPHLDRTFVLEIDGRPVEFTTGQAISVACTHADGKSHTLSARQSPVQRFDRAGLRFSYPVDCSVLYDQGEDEIAASIRHPAGPVVQVHRMTGTVDRKDALERHAATLLSTLKTGGATEIEREEISTTLAGATVTGVQVACRLLDEARVTEVYYPTHGKRPYRVSVDYGFDDAREAQELFELVSRSLILE